ncbi:MAG: hypothetical protein ACLTMP_04205 [Eggerthella lenta]
MKGFFAGSDNLITVRDYATSWRSSGEYRILVTTSVFEWISGAA